jgi:hypothetical protein
MANNKTLKDGNGVDFTTKTTDNAGVNTSHVNVDALPIAFDSGAANSTTQRVILASDDSAVVNLQNISTSLGAPSDAEATSDTGTFSIIAFIKRAMQNWTTLLNRIPTLGNKTSANSQPVTQSVENASGTITTQNLVPNGAATAGSAVEITLNGTSTLAIQVTGTYTGALSIQVTNDNNRWETITASSILNALTGVAAATITSATIGVFQIDLSGFLKARVTGLAAMTGTATITLRAIASAALVTIDNPLPTGTNSIGTATVAGQTAASAASTGNPVRVGGRIAPTTIPTQDTTLIAGDASELAVTPAMQLVMKQNASADLDFNFNFSCLASVVTVQQLIPASGTASIRNYLSNLKLATDTLGAGGVAWILDGALTVSSIATGTGLVTTGTHDLKVGDSVVFTALTGGTGISTNTVYYVTAVGSATTFNIALTIGGTNVVPSAAATAGTCYRILYQQHFRTTGVASPAVIDFPQPLRGVGNAAMSLLIPVSMTSGTIYISSSGYRGV